MTDTDLNLSMRKFMIASSAAITAPTVMKAISKVTTVGGTEKKVTYY
jgi:hypothetical protein